MSASVSARETGSCSSYAGACSAEAVRDAFGREGFAYVRGAVSRAGMASIVAQIADEMASPSIAAESGEVAVTLGDPSTWPSGAGRRVIEVTPPGDSAHWGELVGSAPLAAALDAVLGRGCWELPLNGAAPPGGGPVAVRHWYAPCAFPDVPGGVPRPRQWTPINRRGAAWRGWHVDIGPGFDVSRVRTSKGHPYQGCVVLLLCTDDLEPGGGGTALIRGSHRWVASALAAAGREVSASACTHLPPRL